MFIAHGDWTPQQYSTNKIYRTGNNKTTMEILLRSCLQLFHVTLILACECNFFLLMQEKRVACSDLIIAIVIISGFKKLNLIGSKKSIYLTWTQALPWEMINYNPQLAGCNDPMAESIFTWFGVQQHKFFRPSSKHYFSYHEKVEPLIQGIQLVWTVGI